MPEHIILFDGVCNLCNSSVQFVIRHDRAAIFRFAALQSAAGRRLLEERGLSADVITSVVYLHGGKTYRESAAVLRVARRLEWPWSMLYGFMIVPAFVRDLLYRFIAGNRYRWFGSRNACMLPTPDLQSRFL